MQRVDNQLFGGAIANTLKEAGITVDINWSASKDSHLLYKGGNIVIMRICRGTGNHDDKEVGGVFCHCEYCCSLLLVVHEVLHLAVLAMRLEMRLTDTQWKVYIASNPGWDEQHDHVFVQLAQHCGLHDSYNTV